MVSKLPRIMMDTSAIVAGIISPEGGAGAILQACRLKLIDLYLSPAIIDEATHKFKQKFPELLNVYQRALHELRPIVINDPVKKKILDAAALIEHGDAPILAAAISAPIDYLISHDKDFKTRKVLNAVNFSVVTPGEFLKEFSA